MRVVLDTNIIVSSFLSPKGISAKILDSARAGLFELVVSEAILTEYEEALSKGAVRVRHGLTPAEIAESIEGFREFSILVEPDVTLTVIKDDPDDNKSLECAVTGKAPVIITRDPDLLSVGSYQDILVIPPHLFPSLLEEETAA
jgi:putative PIN family toxin of toxin-antitoxin system